VSVVNLAISLRIEADEYIKRSSIFQEKKCTLEKILATPSMKQKDMESFFVKIVLNVQYHFTMLDLETRL